VGLGHFRLALTEVPQPVAGTGEVLVRVRATSLARRDLDILDGEPAPGDGIAGGVPHSDAATLPRAAVTARAGLFERGRQQPGQYLLLEGTWR
jgi:NADPH:quinone reductase-like Zn-dependent oxidoreductase